MPQSNQTEISKDVSPLLQYLWRNGLVPPTAYLGAVEFGSEAFHSTDTVTFSVQNYTLNVTTGTAPSLKLDSTFGHCKSLGAAHRPTSYLGLVALFLAISLL